MSENTPKQTVQDLSNEGLFEQWATWKERAVQAMAAERILRAEIARRFFPTPTEGSNNAEILLDGVTRKVTLTQPIDRKVDEPLFRALQAAVGQDKATAAGAGTASRHPLADVNLDELIRLKPELATTAYRKLTDVQRSYFETVLIIKDGSPQVALKPLKTK